MIRLKIYSLLFFIVCMLASCSAVGSAEHRLERSLEFAGDNRAEQEAVLAHFIFPGDTYELLYYAGCDGWWSLGVQTAVGKTVNFQGPAGALFLAARLHAGQGGAGVSI